MDWIRLRSYSRKRQAQKNVHYGSPLPGVATSATAKGPQLRLDLHSKPRVDSRCKRNNRNAITKALPKIHEISEVIQRNCLSSDQRSMGVNEDINEIEKTATKDSLNFNSASKRSLRNSDTTSGMTLPTGVSDFLLDCLDMDSLVDSSTESSECASSYSSPEIFRDGKEETSASPEEPYLECKNSTLLDTSKAINIDKMPQLPNLSKILGGQDQNITSGRPLKQKLSSGLTNASAVVAGKQVHKILSTKELRSESQSSEPLLLPPKHKTQADNQQSKKMKCKKKRKSKGTVESPASSSFHFLLSSPGKNKAEMPVEKLASEQPDAIIGISSRSRNLGRNRAILASTAFLQPEDVELDLSSVHKCSPSEDFLPNTNSLYVNSEEIVPATLSPEHSIYQCLRNPPEICSIIKASPGFRPLKVLQHPLNRRELFFPPESSEDIITSSET